MLLILTLTQETLRLRILSLIVSQSHILPRVSLAFFIGLTQGSPADSTFLASGVAQCGQAFSMILECEMFPSASLFQQCAVVTGSQLTLCYCSTPT
jgi:hypothetical protein